jgi:hypothetical protein
MVNDADVEAALRMPQNWRVLENSVIYRVFHESRNDSAEEDLFLVGDELWDKAAKN